MLILDKRTHHVELPEVETAKKKWAIKSCHNTLVYLGDIGLLNIQFYSRFWFVYDIIGKYCRTIRVIHFFQLVIKMIMMVCTVKLLHNVITHKRFYSAQNMVSGCLLPLLNFICFIVKVDCSNYCVYNGDVDNYMIIIGL